MIFWQQNTIDLSDSVLQAAERSDSVKTTQSFLQPSRKNFLGTSLDVTSLEKPQWSLMGPLTTGTPSLTLSLLFQE